MNGQFAVKTYAEQVAQVDSRVAHLGEAFAPDRDLIRNAVRHVEPLRARLGLGELVRSLNPGTGKPQLLLLFRDRDGAEVVLKVYGLRRPNEAAVQGLWAGAGAPVVPVLGSGNEPVSWLLMPYVDGEMPTVRPGLTAEVAAIARTAHEVPRREVGAYRDLHAGIAVHLHHCLDAVRAHGYRVPELLERSADRWYRAGGPLYLHGDLTPFNLLRRRDGVLLALDTCGYTGPAEFDAARWCARVGGSQEARGLLAEWTDVEDTLEAGLAERLLGLELAMEAGVREKRKQEQNLDPRSRDPETLQLLGAAAELLDGPS